MAQGKPIAVKGVRILGLAALVIAAAGLASAETPHRHGHAHGKTGTATTTANPANTPGFPDIKGGDFTLVDGQGRTRTARDPAARPQLLFFGYASCQAICAVALPRMARVVDELESQGVIVTPVMITVDPARDTVAALEPALRKHHPRFVGLTGSEQALAAAYRAFQVDHKLVFKHPDHGDVFAHGSYFYLLAGDGRFLTLLPPVLGPERIAEVALGYLDEAKTTRHKQTGNATAFQR